MYSCNYNIMVVSSRLNDVFKDTQSVLVICQPFYITTFPIAKLIHRKISRHANIYIRQHKTIIEIFAHETAHDLTKILLILIQN